MTRKEALQYLFSIRFWVLTDGKGHYLRKDEGNWRIVKKSGAEWIKKEKNPLLKLSKKKQKEFEDFYLKKVECMNFAAYMALGQYEEMLKECRRVEREVHKLEKRSLNEFPDYYGSNFDWEKSDD